MARGKSITEIAILSLLEIKPMYGVEMVEEIKRLSGNIVVMPLPTLYSSLHKLATKKLVNSYWQEAEVGGRRHVYNITKAGRDYYEKNKFEINYQSLKDEATRQEKESSTHEYKTYSTLEEAFSLPLNNKPELPEDKRVLKMPEPEPEPKVQKNKTTPYLVPTDKISTSEPKHKQMTIGLSGTVGGTDLRPFIKLNPIQAGNDFVIINKLRIVACLVNTLLFMLINFLFSYTSFAKSEYHNFLFFILLIYFAIMFAIFLVFPKNKIIFSAGKSFKIRSLITLLLLAIIVLIAVIDKSFALLWLCTFALLPLVEGLVMLILRKGKIFIC